MNPIYKKRKNETVETKRPWAKNKKAAMLGLVHEADKKFTEKYKWAELMGSAHINTELDRAESCATSDCHAGCLRGLGRLLVTKTPQ